MTVERFSVWCPARGQEVEDARIMEAHGAQDAAERWAEWDDARSAEYLIAGKGQTEHVRVKNLKTLEESLWAVSGEPMPVYRARPVR